MENILFLEANGPNSTDTPGLSVATRVVGAIAAIAATAMLLIVVVPTIIVVLFYLAKCYRARRSKALLEEALKHGFIQSQTVVCLLVGVAGAGKTHTKHLLFGWAPPEVRDSTPLAVRPVRAVRVISGKNGQLQEVNFDQLGKTLADAVANGVHLNKRAWNCCKRCRNTLCGRISRPSPSHLYESSKKPYNDTCCCCCQRMLSDFELQLQMELNETVQQISTSSGSQHLSDENKKLVYMYLIDSGGQMEFLEVLPAFLQHTSICLFVTKLSEELGDRPIIEYFEDGNPGGNPLKCPFTNIQMLLHCVQTIQSQCTQVGSDTDQTSRKAVVVGTHRDLENECSESREQKNKILKDVLAPFEERLLYHGQQLKELIFPVNAKSPDEQDREVAEHLTEEIWNTVSNTRNTPISWFKLEQYIQKLASYHDKKLLHKKECLKVAQYFHITIQGLDEALDHLSSLGIIHYYRNLLPDVVFVDPQFLLQKISELVKYHYKLRSAPDPHAATQGGLKKFVTEGCITLKLLEQFPEQYTDFFTPADFLKLMNDRLIAAHLISNDEYFMPCLLRTMESQEIDQYRVTASSVAPLAIHFSCKLVPHGVFCSLVAFLRSSENSSPWSLYPHPENSTEPQCLTRNCIKFQLPKGAPGSLTLIDTFSHFEVHVNTRRDVCIHLCPSIWQTLAEGIQKVAKTLKYHLHPKQAFLCKHKNTRPHLALPADTFDYWKCELHPDISGPLKEEHKLWKGMQAPTEEVRVIVEVPPEVDEVRPTVDYTDRPTVLECTRFQGKQRTINIPQEIGSNYYYFGLHLLDDPNGTRVRSLELEYRQNVERINTEILREWVTGRGKKPVTWETLTEVLCDIELGALASEIEEIKLELKMSTIL